MKINSGYRQLLEANLQETAVAMVQADAAAGSYGVLCCQCGVELGADRLTSDPAAVFRTDCTTEREIHGNRKVDAR